MRFSQNNTSSKLRHYKVKHHDIFDAASYRLQPSDKQLNYQLKDQIPS